jgi:hypothetical protein
MAFTAVTTRSMAEGHSDVPVQNMLTSERPDLGASMRVIHTVWPEPDFESMNQHFGRIEFAEGDTPTDRWFRRFCSLVSPPWKCRSSAHEDIRIERLPFANEVAKSFNRIASRVVYELGEMKAIESGLHIIGRCGGIGIWGSRGGEYAPHSWGAGITFDPARNPYQSKRPADKKKHYNIDDRIIEMFKDEGWRWHGDNDVHFDPGSFTATKR